MKLQWTVLQELPAGPTPAPPCSSGAVPRRPGADAPVVATPRLRRSPR